VTPQLIRADMPLPLLLRWPRRACHNYSVFGDGEDAVANMVLVAGEGENIHEGLGVVCFREW
jgi:hypothetical protein